MRTTARKLVEAMQENLLAGLFSGMGKTLFWAATLLVTGSAAHYAVLALSGAAMILLAGLIAAMGWFVGLLALRPLRGESLVEQLHRSLSLTAWKAPLDRPLRPHPAIRSLVGVLGQTTSPWRIAIGGAFLFATAVFLAAWFITCIGRGDWLAARLQMESWRQIAAAGSVFFAVSMIVIRLLTWASASQALLDERMSAPLPQHVDL